MNRARLIHIVPVRIRRKAYALVLPKITAAPALFVGSAVALLLGVAAAGTLAPNAPVKVFSEDTEMSATGRLMQIAVSPPPKTPVAPANGKLETMPENLGETPMFHSALQSPPVTPVPAPQYRRRAEPEVIYEEEVEIEPEYARPARRWRDAPVYEDEDGYMPRRAAPYQEARNRYEEGRDRDPRYGNRRDYDYGARAYTPPPAPPYAQPYYRYAEPRYEERW
jgi:hypothetical protein